MYLSPQELDDLHDAPDDVWIAKVAWPIAQGVASDMKLFGDDKDDAVQVATLAMWKARGRVVKGWSAFNFLTKVGKHAIMDEWRKHDRAEKIRRVELREARSAAVRQGRVTPQRKGR